MKTDVRSAYYSDFTYIDVLRSGFVTLFENIFSREAAAWIDRRSLDMHKNNSILNKINEGVRRRPHYSVTGSLFRIVNYDLRERDLHALFIEENLEIAG